MLVTEEEKMWIHTSSSSVTDDFSAWSTYIVDSGNARKSLTARK
jgi:hypothetical protein